MTGHVNRSWPFDIASTVLADWTNRRYSSSEADHAAAATAGDRFVAGILRSLIDDALRQWERPDDLAIRHDRCAAGRLVSTRRSDQW
jgi:hypothetical protein